MNTNYRISVVQSFEDYSKIRLAESCPYLWIVNIFSTRRGVKNCFNLSAFGENRPICISRLVNIFKHSWRKNRSIGRNNQLTIQCEILNYKLQAFVEWNIVLVNDRSVNSLVQVFQFTSSICTSQGGSRHLRKIITN